MFYIRLDVTEQFWEDITWWGLLMCLRILIRATLGMIMSDKVSLIKHSERRFLDITVRGDREYKDLVVVTAKFCCALVKAN